MVEKKKASQAKKTKKRMPLLTLFYKHYQLITGNIVVTVHVAGYISSPWKHYDPSKAVYCRKTRKLVGIAGGVAHTRPKSYTHTRPFFNCQVKHTFEKKGYVYLFPMEHDPLKVVKLEEKE